MRTLTLVALLSLLLALLGSGLPAAAAPAGNESAATGEPAAEAAPLADPPVLVSPLDGATTTGASDPPVGVPTLRWAPVTGATRYHVQISASAGFATRRDRQGHLRDDLHAGNRVRRRTYYWRVKAQIGTTWERYSQRLDVQQGLERRRDHRAATDLTAEGAERAAFQPPTTSPGHRWQARPPTVSRSASIPASAAPPTLPRRIKPHHTPTLRLANNTYYLAGDPD